jgi:hypothetical protein
MLDKLPFPGNFTGTAPPVPCLGQECPGSRPVGLGLAYSYLPFEPRMGEEAAATSVLPGVAYADCDRLGELLPEFHGPLVHSGQSISAECATGIVNQPRHEAWVTEE